MEPLKKAQVEGFLMFAEPEVLFGNLDELCCVSNFKNPIKIFFLPFLMIFQNSAAPLADSTLKNHQKFGKK